MHSYVAKMGYLCTCVLLMYHQLGTQLWQGDHAKLSLVSAMYSEWQMPGMQLLGAHLACNS